MTKEPEMELIDKRHSVDGSIKYLWRLSDDRTIESIYFTFRDQTFTCISSQVGCNVACPFCETGKQQALRNLTDDEIVEQVRLTLADLSSSGEAGRLDHVAVAGMGEPLLNLEHVARAAARVRSEKLAAVYSISTSGIVPRMRELAGTAINKLFVSLHATNDETRNYLVPVNKKYPLGDVLAACRDLHAATREPVTLSYLMFAGLNDRDADLDWLKTLDKEAFILQLAVWNNIEGATFVRSPRVEEFENALRAEGFQVYITRSKGDDVDGGCGQLRSRYAQIRVRSKATNGSSSAPDAAVRGQSSRQDLAEPDLSGVAPGLRGFFSQDLDANDPLGAALLVLGDPRSTEDARLWDRRDVEAPFAQAITRHGCLATLLERVRLETIAPAVLRELSTTFGLAPQRVDALRSAFGADHIGFREIIPFARFAAASEWGDDRAARIALNSVTRTIPFHTRREALAGEPASAMRDLLDARINAILVGHLAAAVGECVLSEQKSEQQRARAPITREHLNRFVSHIMRVHWEAVAPAHYRAFGPEVARLASKGARSITLVSVGCGNGECDLPIYNQLQRDFPEVRFSIVGVDPYSHEEGNFIAQKGALIAEAPSGGAPYIPFILERGAPKTDAYVIMAKYAFHHFADRTLESFVETCAGAGSVLLLEEPTTPVEMGDIMLRLARIGYDLLCACAFDVGWNRRCREDAETFKILFIEEERGSRAGFSLRPIPGVYPSTATLVLDRS